jgi:nucleoside-diphosphate-sugar epimerase
LLYANARQGINVKATVLTRNTAGFSAKSPHIAYNPAITLLEGDIEDFAFPREAHTHIIHAATDSGGRQQGQPPEALADSILTGTERVLTFAHHTRAQRLLFTSTGAVYGRSTTLLHTPESYIEGTAMPLPPHSYEATKRAAELMLLERTPSDVETVIARCFAFVGPHLPLDQHFAIGNFIGAALADRPIVIRGDGTPRRSWLYMADLAIWLWTMLAQGKAGRAYNVGSDNGMTIAAAATRTADVLRPGLPIEIHGTPDPAAPLNSYVPDISRARAELALEITVPFDEALRRTAAWYR